MFLNPGLFQKLLTGRDFNVRLHPSFFIKIIMILLDDFDFFRIKKTFPFKKFISNYLTVTKGSNFTEQGFRQHMRMALKI